MKQVTIAVALLCSACGGASPPEQQIADQCQLLTDAFSNATARLQAHQLSDAQIHTVIALEPIAQAYCNPDAPPTDTRTALQNIHDAVGQLALIAPTGAGGK